MSIWRVEGGRPLSGSVRVQGAKNAVLPVMAASIVTPCVTELLNVPDLRDVSAAVAILEHLGCTAVRDGDVLTLDSRGLCRCDIPHDLMREMRSSVIFLGAILARCGEAKIYAPGGCELGARPIDLHLSALRALGAEISEQGGCIICRGSVLKGARINLSFPSVGATENAMLAAVGAGGRTIITNAAREPELADLQNYLRDLGAEVSGAGESTIFIDGFRPVDRVGHRVMTDRIATATLMSCCASAGGDVELKSVCPAHFSTVTDMLRSMGCLVTEGGGAVRICSGGGLKAPRPASTAPYPGFPTDAQPLVMAACLRCEGTAVFTENIFENRYRHASELRRLGAEVSVVGPVAMVTGVPELYGATVTAPDLRGGAALVTAALAAVGQTVIYDDGHITRGYDDLAGVLSELGGSVSFEE